MSDLRSIPTHTNNLTTFETHTHVTGKETYLSLPLSTSLVYMIARACKCTEDARASSSNTYGLHTLLIFLSLIPYLPHAHLPHTHVNTSSAHTLSRVLEQLLRVGNVPCQATRVVGIQLQ